MRERVANRQSTAMRRTQRDKGFFIAFDYTDHALIMPLTVHEILTGQIARKLA